MFAFGSGVLLGQRTDVANSTPVNFGLVQEVSIDVSFTTKQLFGQFQFPVAVGRGTSKVNGKAKVARISGLAFANLFFGVPLSTGQLATAYGEAAIVPASPFTVTVANAATFVDDYAPVYSASGLPLTRVASGPAVGQYSVNTGTGVYTFAAADTGKAMLMNYTYTIAAVGEQFTVTNPLLGVQPTFQCELTTTFQGNPLNVKIFQCIASKLALQTKLEDFTIPEFSFEIFANTAGNVFQWSFGEAS